jgi:hypothetical protein
MNTFEKIGLWLSPAWWIIYIISVILYLIYLLWTKVIWCNKRWYYNRLDYWCIKKQFNKGLTEEQIKAYKFLVETRKDHPNREKVKLLIDSTDNKT